MGSCYECKVTKKKRELQVFQGKKQGVGNKKNGVEKCGQSGQGQNGQNEFWNGSFAHYKYKFKFIL
ncbi:MAG: hypothetical protein IJV33_01255 [Bacteroidaceae bacterium]|nr:hypothetical protein [Bacteroidaceae bacterium]